MLLGLVSSFGRAGMTQVDVLLGILAVEVDVVRRLTKVWGARHARVPIGDIKPT